jgi:hypothetical protein
MRLWNNRRINFRFFGRQVSGGAKGTTRLLAIAFGRTGRSRFASIFTAPLPFRMGFKMSFFDLRTEKQKRIDLKSRPVI